MRVQTEAVKTSCESPFCLSTNRRTEKDTLRKRRERSIIGTDNIFRVECESEREEVVGDRNTTTAIVLYREKGTFPTSQHGFGILWKWLVLVVVVIFVRNKNKVGFGSFSLLLLVPQLNQLKRTVTSRTKWVFMELRDFHRN
jgi:hypothetical protein